MVPVAQMVRALPDQTAMVRSNGTGSSLGGEFFFLVFFENEEIPMKNDELYFTSV